MTAELTPYDTGERLEPRPWVQPGTQPKNLAAYGRVDFDNEESSTALTVFVDRDLGNHNSYTLHFENVNVELSLARRQFSANYCGTLQGSSAAGPTHHHRPTHEHRAGRSPGLLERPSGCHRVPGEEHVRKQQVIMVTEGRGVLSGKVGSWGNGVEDKGDWLMY